MERVDLSWEGFGPVCRGASCDTSSTSCPGSDMRRSSRVRTVSRAGLRPSLRASVAHSRAIGLGLLRVSHYYEEKGGGDKREEKRGKKKKGKNITRSDARLHDQTAIRHGYTNHGSSSTLPSLAHLRYMNKYLARSVYLSAQEGKNKSIPVTSKRRHAFCSVKTLPPPLSNPTDDSGATAPSAHETVTIPPAEREPGKEDDGNPVREVAAFSEVRGIGAGRSWSTTSTMRSSKELRCCGENMASA